MELKELKKKTISDLHKILAESRDKLRDLRFKDANKQLKNVREIRSVRRVIAWALMLISGDKNGKEGKKTEEAKEDKTKEKEADKK
ncbi:50S ribosomal protein L29 [Candidatus Falkowbacteria bacterium RIFOXYB2_FULL_47_14]|uniref:Large ribosomal subunit protein uL29 n=1 Tax=Candidatus Falkowbacteria bacterium RIFOXYA2_FULL_47_19 TaxID=1797994 RepID=A0A1F5SI38_9BACT|nr:MAG: 50S ribosomal protein L29 [Candidatus Falkowbacteria bacterium RIFOXYA2_FULL_47_19]OGF35453.1 MAG: 50S ribosomal protein L29 [Candidatus Falkowbacteria bacterium RIFOXYC2_FULL_46_15]OGF42555.1 MAG: 50S ribosomal protein L29 [Candidatus Falkowbacteria bacterium RIFOXYB2_FULL_47_14]